ncbi:hypothetical protein ACJX0J_011455, partial [Zea mays]
KTKCPCSNSNNIHFVSHTLFLTFSGCINGSIIKVNFMFYFVGWLQHFEPGILYRYLLGFFSCFESMHRLFFRKNALIIYREMMNQWVVGNYRFGMQSSLGESFGSRPVVRLFSDGQPLN